MKTIIRSRSRQGPAIPSGEMLLEEFLTPLGLRQAEAAQRLGISVNRLNEVVLGKRRTTAETAPRLSRLLKTSPQFWMRLQADWDLHRAVERVSLVGRPHNVSQLLPRGTLSMDKSTKGAWLLTQSKSLDAVTGISAAKLENISYAGRIGRLYNLLRRNVADDPNPTIDAEIVKNICHLNNIDRPSREKGLDVLAAAGRIDIAQSGAISVLGATSRAVLETTTDVFADASPTPEEEAVLDLSEEVAKKPVTRQAATEFLGDTYRIPSSQVLALIDLCKSTANHR